MSNFSVDQLKEAQGLSSVPIATNQVACHLQERHPERSGLLRYCQEQVILLTAYQPLGKGGLMRRPGLKEIAEERGFSPAQPAIAWLLRKDKVIAIPMSSRQDHLKEDLAAADIDLPVEIYQALEKLGWTREVLCEEALGNPRHIDRLEKLIRTGHLLHPLDSVPSSMALFRAVAALCGLPGGSAQEVDGSVQEAYEATGVHGSHTKELEGAIGRSDHYVFVLVDGLGLNLKPIFPKGGFFDTFLHGELRSLFPSTTASVLTSLATGLWPERHAIPAWNTYLPGRARTVKPILFRDRVTEKPLRRFGMTPEEVYPFPSILPDLPVRCRSYLPSGISNETYARYCRGDTPFRGYRSISDAAKKIIAHVHRSIPPGYTYLYLPQVDKAIHEKGLAGDAVVETVAEVDRQLSRLKAELGERARIIVTADHGLIDVRRDAYLVLRDDDLLMRYLLVAPTGESRLPIFHLKEGAEEAFLGAAEKVLGEHFALVSRGWVDERRFFGPHGCSEKMLGRLGEYIGIPTDSAVLEYVPPGKSPRNFFGFHGGLSADEMRLPLFLA